MYGVKLSRRRLSWKKRSREVVEDENNGVASRRMTNHAIIPDEHGQKLPKDDSMRNKLHKLRLIEQ